MMDLNPTDLIRELCLEIDYCLTGCFVLRNPFTLTFSPTDHPTIDFMRTKKIKATLLAYE